MQLKHHKLELIPTQKNNSINSRLMINHQPELQSQARMVRQNPSSLGDKKDYRICFEHRQRIIGICKSPFCDHYKQLCPLCKQEHQPQHAQYFLPWHDAVDEARKLLKNCLDQLSVTRSRKNADMQTYLHNNIVLLQIENSLKEIARQINEKIENFRKQVNNIYFQHVKEKLQDLDEIIDKSEKALKQQYESLAQRPFDSLSKFYTRDLLHDVKYYDSYFNEIFIKKTRHFRTSLQDDKILILMVNFQQNLNKIFTFTQEETSDIRQYHLFRQQDDKTILYRYTKDGHQIEKNELPDISNLVNLPEQYNYKWQGVPQSVFYQPNNCYYIVGQGSKISRQIVKWECSKPLENAFFAVRSMETERKQFGVCELGGQIYIVGGENRTGCLARCEKFVPLYSSQVYIIHSLNTPSTRHSLTTYKNKYIIKFGGVRTFRAGKMEQITEDIAAPPEIYSIQTEEWSVIPIRREVLPKFGMYPSIFKAQTKNLLVILGGERSSQQKVTFSLMIEDTKGSGQQIKMRTLKPKLSHRGRIYNSTVRVDQQQNMCYYMRCPFYNQNLTLQSKKLYNWYH